MDDRQPLGEATQCDSSRLFQLAGQPAKSIKFAPLQLVLVPTGLSVELTKTDQIVGRHSTADVRLPLGDVSRRHCRFVFAAGLWKVIDLDSMNGVYVNDERVKEVVLKHGDRIRIGSFIFEARLAAAKTLPGLRKAS